MEDKNNKIKIVHIFLFLLFFTSSLYPDSLQDVINKAPENSIIKLSPGTYNGNIIINKPLTLLGVEGRVIIKGDNKGNVITIKSSNVMLENLTITNSGNMMINLDSAILVEKSNNIQIIRCRILDSLYGINLSMVNDSKIIDNYITSNNDDISLRGDALKIWYSSNNVFKNNIIDNTRDITLTYSNNNKLIKNIFQNNRFALHISLSENNIIKENTFKYNSVGQMFMGAKNTKVFNNKILSSKGAAGIGVVVAGVSNFIFEENQVSFNSQAIYIDSKDTEEGMQRYFKKNIISYNGEALHFHAAIKNNTIQNNTILGNIDDVVKDVRGNFTNSNLIEYNYWDRYTGFDINKDEIGDTPYRVYQFADQLWHYNNKIKFFYASPIMTLLNFLTNLAPFVEPNLLLEDTKPEI